MAYAVYVASRLGREGSLEETSVQREKMCERREQIDGSQGVVDERDKESIRHLMVVLEQSRACIDRGPRGCLRGCLRCRLSSWTCYWCCELDGRADD